MRWCVVLAACGGAAVAPKPPAQPVTWTDPNGLYQIEVLAPPSQGARQSVTPFGTVDYTLYSFEDGLTAYRMAAFSYPILDAKTARFDAKAELARTSAELVAHMQMTVADEQAVTIAGLPDLIGEDLELGFSDDHGVSGHGILRLLINPLPSAMRFAALCLVPAAESLRPCERFVRTLVPHVPVADGPGSGPPKRPVVL